MSKKRLSKGASIFLVLCMTLAAFSGIAANKTTKKNVTVNSRIMQIVGGPRILTELAHPESTVFIAVPKDVKSISLHTMNEDKDNYEGDALAQAEPVNGNVLYALKLANASDIKANISYFIVAKKENGNEEMLRLTLHEKK